MSVEKSSSCVRASQRHFSPLNICYVLGLGFRGIVLWGAPHPHPPHTHSWGKGKTVLYWNCSSYLHVVFLAYSGKELSGVGGRPQGTFKGESEGPTPATAGSPSFCLGWPPGPVRYLLPSLDGYSCCWDTILSFLPWHPQPVQGQQTLWVVVNRVWVAAKRPKPLRSPRDNGNYVLCSFWSPVLQRGGHGAVKWVSVPPAHSQPGQVSWPPLCLSFLVCKMGLL